MPVAFVRFGCIFPLHDVSAIALSVCDGFGICLCPIPSKIILMYTALRVMMQSATSSASVADFMTRLIMCAMLIIVQLFWGIVASLDKNKFPPARLLAFGLLR